jgi:sugar-specific transcriptional regulator TrmB
MIQSDLKIFSPQATDIYRLLRESQSLTAKEIAVKLHILPHAVYRVMSQLHEKGFVQESATYPVKYMAIPEAEALDAYTTTIRQHFRKAFFHKNINGSQTLDISFIKDREYLRENTDRDVMSAKSTVNFIVSGLEVPAETILIYKQALDRGVKIKALVQRLDDTSEAMFKNWKKIGVEVRYFPNMEARIFAIDKQIVYFTSYHPEHKEEAIGMRFDYAPYAKIMDESFEQRWNFAKRI